MLEIKLEQTTYKPGEILKGEVAGDELKTAQEIKVNLFWYTQGKGTEDLEVVNSLDLPIGGLSHSFSFNLPQSPWSVSGELLTIAWAIEVIADKEYERKDFILSPLGSELRLGTPKAASLRKLSKNIRIQNARR